MAQYSMGIIDSRSALFSDVTRDVLPHAGKELGLKEKTLVRELERMLKDIGPAADALIKTVEDENKTLPDLARQFFARELRVMRSIRYIVIADMMTQLNVNTSVG